MEEGQPRKKGRPSVVIDLETVQNLASRGLSKKMVCASMGIDESTWHKKAKTDKKLNEAYDRGYSQSVFIMKNTIFDAGKKDWKAAEAWLKGHGELENRVKVEQTGQDGGPIEIVDIRKTLHERLEKLLRSADASPASEADQEPDGGGS